MKRVAVDENLHYLFYRDLASAAFELDPSAMVIGLNEEVRVFAMPGTGIPNFASHARAISNAGIYDFGVHHDQILTPVIKRFWGLEKITGLNAEAERARESLLEFIARMGKVARRRADRVAAAADALPSEKSPATT
jgi:acyl-[acyl-carrier-protein] desaturase